MTSAATPRPIIIDTDPGQDDAIAILLALGSPELEVLGVVAVAGNVPLSWTTRNSLLLCELAGRPDVPVFAGCDRPMVRRLVTAEAVHGQTGLDGPDWSEPTTVGSDRSARVEPRSGRAPPSAVTRRRTMGRIAACEHRNVGAPGLAERRRGVLRVVHDSGTLPATATTERLEFGRSQRQRDGDGVVLARVGVDDDGAGGRSAGLRRPHR